MNGLFYMIILTYTPNERDIIQMHQILFLEYLMKIPKRRSTSSPKSTYFCPSKQCQSDNMINLIILTPKSYVDPT